MIKLAFAIAFLAVFGIVAYAIVVKLIFPPEKKKEETTIPPKMEITKETPSKPQQNDN